MADKKENLIEEEVKETKKATRKKKSDEEGAKSRRRKSTGYSGKVYGKMQGNTCNSQEEKECP